MSAASPIFIPISNRCRNRITGNSGKCSGDGPDGIMTSVVSTIQTPAQDIVRRIQRWAAYTLFWERQKKQSTALKRC